MSAVTIIPARMGSSRLPGKVLADIAGKTMIERVVSQAQKAEIGDVVVACCEQEVFDVVTAFGGKAVMTKPEHPSGTDRIFEAFGKLNSDYEYIINVQGDLPTIDPKVIHAAYEAVQSNHVDIATLTAAITRDEERENPNVVKAIFAGCGEQKAGKALYFSRATAPYGDGALFHHIGLYAYTKDALEQFVSLPPSVLEKREKLEQLRAVEAGMHIEVVQVDTVPFGVDTQEDLTRAISLVNN